MLILQINAIAPQQKHVRTILNYSVKRTTDMVILTFWIAMKLNRFDNNRFAIKSDSFISIIIPNENRTRAQI